MSADGSKLTAGTAGGPIYRSTDAGVSWSQLSAPSTNWSYLASSADGSTLAALANAGQGLGGQARCWVFLSTDAGQSWTQSSLDLPIWNSFAISADGQRFLVAPTLTYSGWPFYRSTNSGLTWETKPGPILRSIGVTCAADGAKAYAASVDVGCGGVFASTNFGDAWMLTGAGGCNYGAVICSGDGSTVLGQDGAGGIWASTNSGATWCWAQVPNSQPFPSSACSADGSVLATAGQFDYTTGWKPFLLVSIDYGLTWQSNSTPTTNGLSIAISADGQKLVALSAGAIWISQKTTQPKLTTRCLANGLLVSWVIPSQPFTLQESSDLNPSSWTDVSVQPVLNFTNLHHEVTVPLSSSNRFFRLKGL